jgi:hypothetical protein
VFRRIFIQILENKYLLVKSTETDQKIIDYRSWIINRLKKYESVLFSNIKSGEEPKIVIASVRTLVEVGYILYINSLI